MSQLVNKYSLDNRLIFNNNININDKEFKQINKLKTLKLSKLQDICVDYNINIYKYEDTRKLLKKNELYEELKIKLIK